MICADDISAQVYKLVLRGNDVERRLITDRQAVEWADVVIVDGPPDESVCASLRQVRKFDVSTTLVFPGEVVVSGWEGQQLMKPVTKPRLLQEVLERLPLAV